MKDKKAVSAVIGVILMCSITIAIAATVFVMVTMDRDNANDELYVEGWTTGAYIETTINVSGESVDIWNVTLSNSYVSPTDSTTYMMIFIGDVSPPPLNVEIRCFYKDYEHEGDTYLEVYRVKSL